MFHIAQQSTGGSTLHLSLEGNLDSDHAPALQEVVNDAVSHRIIRCTLHCEGLRRVDDDGVRLLLRLKLAGARLEGLPWYIAWKLSLVEPKSNQAL